MPAHITRAMIVASTWTVAAPITWACSACIKDIVSPAEFDRRAWDSSEHVFVGIVMAAEASRLDESMIEIEYRLDIEETFKGNAADFDQRIYTRRSVPDRNQGILAVICNETLVGVGDRLLVFSDPAHAISVGRCTSTRVIEGQAAVPRDEVRDTLARVKRWRDDL